MMNGRQVHFIFFNFATKSGLGLEPGTFVLRQKKPTHLRYAGRNQDLDTCSSNRDLDLLNWIQVFSRPETVASRSQSWYYQYKHEFGQTAINFKKKQNVQQ